MKNFLEIVSLSPLFNGMDDSETESALKFLDAYERDYEKNTYILSSGEKIDSVGMLLCGSILIIQEDFWGNRNILAGISAGNLFAESFACTPGAVINVSVVAEEKSTVLWLSSEKLLASGSTSSFDGRKIINNLISEISAKNLHLNTKITHICKRTTRDKLLSYLSGEAQKAGVSEFVIPFSRQQLADYLSVDRSAMSAELSKLQKDGLIKFSKNNFKLL
ncbi:MAG: Crp/Fnr family transcriptional regulator [Firmicutes bacterium]|nr:Crp/Fnr family transcriptional regulator [Bacillota bacterium]